MSFSVNECELTGIDAPPHHRDVRSMLTDEGNQFDAADVAGKSQGKSMVLDLISADLACLRSFVVMIGRDLQDKQ